MRRWLTRAGEAHRRTQRASSQEQSNNSMRQCPAVINPNQSRKPRGSKVNSPNSSNNSAMSSLQKRFQRDGWDQQAQLHRFTPRKPYCEYFSLACETRGRPGEHLISLGFQELQAQSIWKSIYSISFTVCTTELSDSGVGVVSHNHN